MESRREARRQHSRQPDQNGRSSSTRRTHPGHHGHCDSLRTAALSRRAFSGTSPLREHRSTASYVHSPVGAKQATIQAKNVLGTATPSTRTPYFPHPRGCESLVFIAVSRTLMQRHTMQSLLAGLTNDRTSYLSDPARHLPRPTPLIHRTPNKYAENHNLQTRTH